MKVLINSFIKIIFLSLIGATTGFAVTGPKNITFGFENKEVFPWYIGNDDKMGEYPGVMVETMREVAAEMGVKLELKRMPWTRCLLEIKSGDLNATFSGSFKKDRLENGVYPHRNQNLEDLDKDRHLHITSYVLYRKKYDDFPHVKWDGNTINGISAKSKIGVPKGYSIIDDLVKKYQIDPAHIEESPQTIHDFKKLLSGRVALAAALEDTGDVYLSQDKEINKWIEKLSPPLVKKEYFLIFSHQFYNKYPQFAEAFWDRLVIFRKSAKFQNLRDKYNKNFLNKE
ncbi:MAG: transporter substrate-binding domain-containing protein [Oligoflexia bacterium]|nr:transporter substrate-binding domain-containing protein [Oligoflexia bacterium]